MKTETSMSRIIDTRKNKSNRTMIDCNCKICVNRGRHMCRFGWEPINGKCNRFGTNHYTLSKEEAIQAREQTIINLEKNNKDNEIKNTTLKALSNALDTILTVENIKSCTRSSYFGNGKFGIKCTNLEEMIISIKFKDGRLRRYKVFDYDK